MAKLARFDPAQVKSESPELRQPRSSALPAANGSVTLVTVVPCPSTDSILKAPPCISASERTNASPSPVPGWRPELLDNCTNGLPIRPNLASGDADARVGDAQMAELPFGADAHGHAPPSGRELDRVGQQVEQDLLQGATVGVEEHRRGAIRSVPSAIPPAAARSASSSTHSRTIGAASDALAVQLELTGLDLRHIQDVADQIQQMRPRTVDEARILFVVRIADRPEHLRLDHLREAEHGVQRRAQLMAHIGEEGGFGVARLLRHFLGEEGFLARGLGALDRAREAFPARGARPARRRPG